MDVYTIGELRLVLNRTGHREWRLEPDQCAGQTLIIVRDRNNRMRFYLTKVPRQGHWTACAPLGNDGWRVNEKATPAEAMTDMLQWLEQRQSPQKPTKRTSPGRPAKQAKGQLPK